MGCWYCNEIIRDRDRKRETSGGAPELLPLAARADPRPDSEDGTLSVVQQCFLSLAQCSAKLLLSVCGMNEWKDRIAFQRFLGK